MNIQDRIDQAKKQINWQEGREPTALEYLRNYRHGSIGEVHMLAILSAEKAFIKMETLEITDPNLNLAVDLNSDYPKVIDLTTKKEF